MDRILRFKFCGAILRFLFIVVLGALSGCATAGPDNAGWRTGWVHEIVEGKNVRKTGKGSECVRALPAEQVARSRFAVIWYHQGRKSRPQTVLLSDWSGVLIGDKVRVNIYNCNLPISRIPPLAAATEKSQSIALRHTSTLGKTSVVRVEVVSDQA